MFGLQRTAELLLPIVENVFWYSLLDLPPAWEATTRHKESEGSSYYRHFYMGLIRADGTPKARRRSPSTRRWGSASGSTLTITGWTLPWSGCAGSGSRRCAPGISWADWHRPNAVAWFDRQMAALEEFDTTVTFCFTPPSRGKWEHHTSPPVDNAEFAYFAEQVVRRYVRNER